MMKKSEESSTNTEEVLISLRKIIQSIDLYSRHLTKTVGLTGPQLVLLHTVAKSEAMSAGAIAKATSLSQATVTGILERLEKREFILRHRSETDRRKVFIELSEKGQRILEQAPPLMEASFVKAFSRLEDWEQSLILSALQRLVGLMDAKRLNAAPILAAGSLVSDPTEAKG